MPARFARSARLAIVGAALACAVPAMASAANTVAVPASPINKPLTTKWSASTVTVRSVLKTPQTGLVLQVRAPKGVQVTILGARKGATVKQLPSLKPRATTKVQLRVRRTAKGPKTPRINLRVVKGGKSVGTGRVVVRNLATKPARGPRIVVRLSGAAVRTLPAGRSAMVRATVTNTGTTAARNVRLRVTGTGLVMAPAQRALGTLAAKRTKTVNVRVTRRAAKGTLIARFAVTRTGGPGATTIRRFTPPAAPKPANHLVGHTFLKFDGGVTGLIQPSYTGYAFVNDQWAYRGFSAEGIPSCTARTAVGTGDGCVPYTCNAAANTVTLDGQTAQLNAARTTITLGEDTFILKVALTPDSRHEAVLRSISVFGLFPNSVVSTRYLTLTMSGEFALTSSMMGSVAGGATTSWVTSPDEKGTYRIVPGNVIELHYANGTVERRTIFVDTFGEPTGSPQADGLILGDQNYYTLDD